MNLLLDAAREVCDFMASRSWEFCIIGGLAVQRWGEPRTTLDADITLLTGWGDEAPYVDALLEAFKSRIEDGRTFALSRRVVLVRASNGTPVDITLGALPFEAEMIGRATPVEFAPGIGLPCCTAEDLIIMKAFAGRPRDWLDVENIVIRRRGLDAKYILKHLADFSELKDDPGLPVRVEQLLKGEA